MKHLLDAVRRGPRHTRLAQVRLDEIHCAVAKVTLDIFQAEQKYGALWSSRELS